MAKIDDSLFGKGGINIYICVGDIDNNYTISKCDKRTLLGNNLPHRCSLNDPKKCPWCHLAVMEIKRKD